MEKSAHLDRLVPERSVESERNPVNPRGLPSPFARVDRGVYVILFLVAALGFAIYWTVRHRHTAANEAIQAQRRPSRPTAVVPVTGTTPAQTSRTPSAA